MALPTAADLKSYLRIEHTAEDVLLAQLLARATAAVIRYLRRAIASTPRCFTELEPVRTLQGRTVIYLPEYPVEVRTLDLVDADDESVDADTYRVDSETGRIVANIDESFDNGPYTVDCKVGLQYSADYANVIEPDVSSAILDIAADYWHHRNPGALSESAGGGVTTTYEKRDETIPPRIQQVLESWRKPRSLA